MRVFLPLTVHKDQANCLPSRPLLGFLIATGALAPALMGWRGAGGGGAANIGVFYFFGGLLQIIGAIFEWLVGNTFIYVVFGSFGEYSSHTSVATRCVDVMTKLFATGAFWLAFAATLTPAFNAETAYTSGATTAAEEAAAVATFEATLGTLYTLSYCAQNDCELLRH
jgi:succinate-acetate transporter protein